MEVFPRSSFQRTSRMPVPLYKTGWSLCNWKIGSVRGLQGFSSSASSLTRKNCDRSLWSIGSSTSQIPQVTEPSKQNSLDVQDGVSTPQSSKSSAYPFTEIETKWQAFWENNQTFKTPDFKDLDTSKPKFYALDMFPYPRLVGIVGIVRFTCSAAPVF